MSINYQHDDKRVEFVELVLLNTQNILDGQILLL